MFDHGTVVNCRFCMQSDLFNGKQEIAKPIIKIFVFVLKLDFFCLNLDFYTHLKNSETKSLIVPFLPVSSSKVKKDLGRWKKFRYFHQTVRPIWVNLLRSKFFQIQYQMEIIIVNMRRCKVAQSWCEVNII